MPVKILTDAYEICIMSTRYPHHKGETLSKDKFTPVPFSVFMDGPTEIDWLIDGVMPQQTTGIIAGEPGIGKTWILMDLVLAIASGSPWLNSFVTQPCNVLYVDEENAHVLVRKRFLEMKWKYEDRGDLDNVQFMVAQTLDITPLEHMSKGLQPSPDYVKLRNVLSDAPYDLVVFDSLTRVHHADENDSSRMSAVFNYVKMLMDDFGVSILFTHHFNKGKGHSNNRLRGSSDILAFPDYVLRVERERGHVEINSNGVAMTHGKSRWGENIGKMYIKLSSTEDGRKEIMHVSIDDLEEAIMIYLDVPRSERDIVKEMDAKGKGDRQMVIRVLNRLVKEHKLYRPGKDVYAKSGVEQFDDLL